MQVAVLQTGLSRNTNSSDRNLGFILPLMPSPAAVPPMNQCRKSPATLIEPQQNQRHAITFLRGKCMNCRFVEFFSDGKFKR
eukprot:1486373-Rhodomonas_salina.2